LFSHAYVFFDVDDTLVEWKIDWADAFVQVAREAGINASVEQATKVLRGAFDGFYNECIAKHAGAGDVREFWMDYDGQLLAALGVTRDLRERTARLIELLSAPQAIALFPEVLQVLRDLRERGARLGIVTGRPAAGPDLERLGIRDCFDFVLDAFTAGSSKSAGHMFFTAAQAAAAAGRTAWHVGDSYSDDVQGAQAAGIRPVLVDRRAAHPDADCLRITNLRPLPEVILDRLSHSERNRTAKENRR
jgi:putative hydrolase of the HAD superfamily